MSNFGKFSKINFYNFLNAFISKPISNLLFSSILNVLNLNQIHIIQRNKCTGMYAHTCCYLMMNFNLMKNFIFLCFHEHKIQK